LHGFVYSQRGPLTWAFDKLQALSNSNYGRTRDFCEAMNEAATALREVDLYVNLHWDMKRKMVTISVTRPAAASNARKNNNGV
jgi:hypothetical protein